MNHQHRRVRTLTLSRKDSPPQRGAIIRRGVNRRVIVELFLLPALPAATLTPATFPLGVDRADTHQQNECTQEDNPVHLSASACIAWRFRVHNNNPSTELDRRQPVAVTDKVKGWECTAQESNLKPSD